LFRRRVKVLLWGIVLAWLVLIGRLAQIQIGWHDRFDLDDYTRAGGNRLLETVRGGIYAYWGTPLAFQGPSFDIAVYYSQLLPWCSEPWGREQVRELLDEYAGAAGATVSDDEGYRRLWEGRSARVESLGSPQEYVRRRLGGESNRDIKNGGVAARNTDDWRPLVARLTGHSAKDLTAEADDTVRKVEEMEARINELRRAKGKSAIRVSERYEWHVVAEDIPAEVAAVVRTEPERFPAVRLGRREEPAVRVLERTARRYPNGGLAAQVVGRVAPIFAETWDGLLDAGSVWRQDQLEDDATWRDPHRYEEALRLYRMDDNLGELGIEKQAEDRLRGRRGYVRNHLVFKFLRYERQSDTVPPEAGEDVFLTLREDFQGAANDALRWASEQPDLDFTAGALVLLDVRSGAVLAAATWPTYDLSEYRSRYKAMLEDPLTPLIFRPTQGVMPTGSVFKVITAIAALQEEKITPSTTFDCEHREVFRAGRASHVFRCDSYHHTISLVPAIEQSCNIYFYHTGLAAGPEALWRWAHAFGLGDPTGVDLPGETRRSKVPKPATPFAVINLSIGQGDMRCTPLQVAGMMAAVANGGRLYTPHFIDHYRKADGTRGDAVEPESTQLNLKPGILDVVREGLRLVVESPKGTAYGLGLDAFGVAGKTGTPEIGEGLPNHAWFAGYLPHDNPKIAFAVVSEKTSTHGGSGAAPILEHCLEKIGDAVESMP
jgi:penicillin-binding protein 2